jgi:hypothetical protein
MTENQFAGQGSVLLDIGGDVGALVVAMPVSMLGTEVEIASVGHHHHDHHHHRAHVAVVDRPVPGGTLPSLVFPELVEGSYDLFDKGDDAVRMSAEVIGGQVTYADWEG